MEIPKGPGELQDVLDRTLAGSGGVELAVGEDGKATLTIFVKLEAKVSDVLLAIAAEATHLRHELV